MKIHNTQSAFLKAAFSSTIKDFRRVFPLLILLFLASCTHKIATDKLPTTQILFGKGGGFTGEVHEYALLEDGRIVKMKNGATEQEVVKKISKEKAASYYAILDSMPSKTWLYNAPGNIYHHITVKKDGKKESKVVWDGGKDDANAPASIVQFYKNLRAELPSKKHRDND